MGETKKVNIEIDDKTSAATADNREGGQASSLSPEESGEKASEDAEKGPGAALQAAKDEAKEYYDRLLRVSAEFDNYKKRTTREISEFRKFANESLVKDLLTVVDNLERAIESASAVSSGEPSADSLVEGITLTLNEILKILERYHVKPIESEGQTFDPCFHQAMMQEEVEDKPDNIILKELQKGYLIHERLLRPAMVVVSKSKQNQK